VQVEYMNWLADQVGEPHLEARRHEMYERALRCIWSLDDRYRDRWEEEEEEHGGGDCGTNVEVNVPNCEASRHRSDSSSS